MATSQADAGERRTASVSELVRALVADLVLLARREAELVASELKHKVSKVGVAAGLFAAAATIGLFGVATLVAAAVLALAIVLPGWAAALIVGVALLVVAAAATLGTLSRRRRTGWWRHHRATSTSISVRNGGAIAASSHKEEGVS